MAILIFLSPFLSAFVDGVDSYDGGDFGCNYGGLGAMEQNTAMEEWGIWSECQNGIRVRLSNCGGLQEERCYQGGGDWSDWGDCVNGYQRRWRCLPGYSCTSEDRLCGDWLSWSNEWKHESLEDSDEWLEDQDYLDDNDSVEFESFFEEIEDEPEDDQTKCFDYECHECEEVDHFYEA